MSLAILEGLLQAKKNDRLHHAYLLAGADGKAKLALVQKLFAKFCGSDQLERIERGNHPDFVHVKPEEEVISVDQIRTLPKSLSYPPLEAEKRFVLIEQAQLMNAQACNALLKILEEPPHHTMFFLFCSDPSELLPTILSRSQVLRIPPLSQAEMNERYATVAGKKILLSWADGSPARADLLLSQELLPLVEEAGIYLVEQWEASPRIPSRTFQWVDSLDSEQKAEAVVDAWELLFRDLAFVCAGAKADDLHFSSLHGRLQSLVKKGLSLQEITKKSLLFHRFRLQRNFHGNLKLNLAALLPDLQLLPPRS